MRRVCLVYQAHGLLALAPRAKSHHPATAFLPSWQTVHMGIPPITASPIGKRTQSHTYTDKLSCAHKNQTKTSDSFPRVERSWPRRQKNAHQSWPGPNRYDAWLPYHAFHLPLISTNGKLIPILRYGYTPGSQIHRFYFSSAKRYR